MVLTPQLLQAIKLLQMPSVELAAFIENEFERNPLLERAEERHEPEAPPEPVADATPGDWASESMPVEAADLARDLGTEVENAFDPDRAGPGRRTTPRRPTARLRPAMVGRRRRRRRRGRADIEAYVASQESFSEFLTRQAMVALPDPGDRLIAAALIDGLDEAGYFRGDLADIAAAARRAAGARRARAVALQTLEPTGVFARDLAECLKLQLIERDRFDPAMAAMIANLPLLAKRDLAALRRVCGVDDEDLVDMIAEIKRLDPKPGRAFAGAPEPLAIPDVIVTAAHDAGWRVELNAEALPRVLVNESYAAVDQARRRARRGPAIYLDPVAERALADQEPGAARPHDPQRRLRDRSPSGRISDRRRRRPETAQPQDRRRRDRRPRIRPSRARPPTNMSRRRAGCSR